MKASLPESSPAPEPGGLPLRCPKTGRLLAPPPRRVWPWRWWFTGMGLVSLLWFLVRVIPKPSRAAYPCQRAAAPMASGFVLWLTGVVAARLAWRHGRAHVRLNRWWLAMGCGVVVLAGGALTLATFPQWTARASLTTGHGPLGEGKGVFPGRVVWVHAPEAVNWDGFSSPEYWWQDKHTDLATVEVMMAKAVRSVAGTETDAAAWEAVFRYFNRTHQRDDRGYQAGEKIAIKINLTACNAGSGDGQVNRTTYQKNASVMNTIDNSPQMLLALLRQLVYEAGVRPEDIAVGDPTGLFPKFMYDYLHKEFPTAVYFDNYGKAGSGRTRTEFSATRFDWSTPAAVGKLQDYVPVPFASATYVINFAILKGHSAGITVCAKNHYGSLLRCPNGYLRDQGTLNYYNLHDSLAGGSAEFTPGTGHYRALVDLMAHPQLGGKTLLYLVDGLFAGYYWDSHPYKWKQPPFGDGVNGNWPASLFASLDPVAIDSVAYDFLLNEWPGVVTGGTGSPGALKGSAEDYLTEAALANDPPSGAFYDPGRTGARLASLGTHEHWNNAADRQYSRNLGSDKGIELVALTASRPAAQLTPQWADGHLLLSWPAALGGYGLQTTTSLTPPVVWQPASAEPVFYQGRNVVTNTPATASAFFRLAK